MPDMILLFVVALILSFWVYRTAIKRAWYLFILRTVGLFLLLVLALRPVFHKEVTLPARVAVLFDRSASMGFPAKSSFEEEVLRRLKTFHLPEIKLQFYSFDTTLYSGIKSGFTNRTAIGKSISMAGEKYIILISDGLNNTGSETIVPSKKVFVLNPPVRSKLVKILDYRPVVTEGMEDTIKIKIAGEGRVELLRDGKTVFSEKASGGRILKIVEKFTSPGIHTYTLRFNGNDIRTFSVHAVKRGKSVLIYASHPDINIRFLRMFMDRKGNISPDFVVNTGNGLKLYKRDTVMDLDSFDIRSYDFCIFIDPLKISGGKALYIFSRKPPPEVLKKLFGVPYFATRVEGELYPVMEDSMLNPISYAWKLSGYPPKTMEIVKTRSRKIPVVFFVGEKAFIMTGDLYLLALFNFSRYSQLLDGIISKLIPEGSFYVELPRTEYVKGEKARITAFAYDRFGNAIDSLFPVIKLGGKSYEMIYSGEGKYIAEVELQDTGKIKGKVVFRSSSGTIKTEPVRFRVKPFEREEPTPEVDTEYLRRLGKTYETVDELKGDLLKIQGEKYEKKFNLRSSWFFFFLAVLLLSVEWFIRRKNGVV